MSQPAPPARVVPLAPVLERDAADDQRDEDQQQRQVEGAEHGRVPGGERGERGPARGEQPDLVAVPDGADRVDHDPAVGVVAAAEERQQDADAEVEALEDEVARPQHGDGDEPQIRQVHVEPPRSVDELHRRVGAAGALAAVTASVAVAFGPPP